MIEMPPGTGKSVVIALLLGLITGKVKSTTILYNDADLLAFEHETITRVCNDMSCQQINVKSLDEIMDKNEHGQPVVHLEEDGLLIVDEADDVFLDKMTQLYGRGAVVCLTATIPS